MVQIAGAPQSGDVNRRILLNSRPDGQPSLDDFRLVTDEVPQAGAGQLLLRTVFLSLDPYMRGRMSEAASYAAPTAIGEVMGGATIARVQSSSHAQFKVGDWVLGMGGWQDFWISDGTGLSKIDANAAQPSLYLGVLGMPGFTAYMGLLDIGQPKAGETVVVAAATGAVGAVVGQIAKLKGCRVVGLVGSAKKSRYAVEELGFDACIDHHSVNLSHALFAACPKGIDVYFESVGGAVFDAVLPVLNAGARIPLCGLIANYNDVTQSDVVDRPDRLVGVMRTLLSKRIKVQGFIIFEDYAPRFTEFSSQMAIWLREGKIKFREDIQCGLELAPQAFIGLLEGQNFGKLVIRVGED
jgi:NADPH-dependent curcumin reductase CurA